MKKYFKNEQGAIPFIAALVMMAIASAVAAGTITINKDVDLSKLKKGQVIYKTNK